MRYKMLSDHINVWYI